VPPGLVGVRHHCDAMRRFASVLLCVGGAASKHPWPPCTDCVDGVVMGGADVVAYFGLAKGDKGIMGSKDHAVEHGGYTYYFSNATTVATFQAAPAKYIPAWGGF